MADKHDEDEVPDYIKKIREETKRRRDQGIKEDWAPRTIRLGQSKPEDARDDEGASS
jgi:hypothetical protein